MKFSIKYFSSSAVSRWSWKFYPITCLIYFLPLIACARPELFSTKPDSTPSRTLTSAPRVHWVRGDAPRANKITLWGGYAFDSFQLWGKTSDVTLGLLGVRYNRSFLRYDNLSLDYTLTLDLFAHYTYPAYTEERERTSLSGVGFSPLGFQVNFLDDLPVHPFLKTSGGFMYLTRPFPDKRGKKLNFTFGAGGGLDFKITQHTSLFIAYRFFHTSNAETGQINPGIDSSFFYGGITFY